MLQDNPRTAMALEREYLFEERSWWQRFKGHAKLTRYALHAGCPRDALRHSTSKALAALSAPAGVALFTRDRLTRDRLRGMRITHS